MVVVLFSLHFDFLFLFLRYGMYGKITLFVNLIFLKLLISFIGYETWEI